MEEPTPRPRFVLAEASVAAEQAMININTSFGNVIAMLIFLLAVKLISSFHKIKFEALAGGTERVAQVGVTLTFESLLQAQTPLNIIHTRTVILEVIATYIGLREVALVHIGGCRPAVCWKSSDRRRRVLE